MVCAFVRVRVCERARLFPFVRVCVFACAHLFVCAFVRVRVCVCARL